MKPILALYLKDLLTLKKDRTALLMPFIVPMLLIILFGYVFGLNRKDSGPVGIPIAVINQSPEPAAADLVEALKADRTFRVITTKTVADGKQVPLTEEDARAALKNNEYRFALILPADMLSEERFGVHMKFLINPRNEIETQTVNGMLQKDIFSKVPHLLGDSLQRGAKKFLGNAKFDSFNRRMADIVADNFGGDRDKIYQDMSTRWFDLKAIPDKPRAKADPTLRRLDTDASPSGEVKEDGKNHVGDLFGRIANLEREEVAGKQVKNPMASRLVGGYAIMFLLFAVTGSIISLFEEKKSGIFQRLLTSPATRSHILWSKFLYCITLGMVQLWVMFIFGHLLYDLELPKHIVPLLCVSLSSAAACASIGMLIVSVSPSQAAAHGITTFVVLAMSSIGGAWFPVSFMPEFIQKLSKLTLVYWSMEGFTSVLWAGEGLMGVLPIIGVLLLIFSVLMGTALWRFRSGNMFD